MIYKSNIDKVINKLKRAVLSTEAQDKLVRSCATAVLGSNLRRIHNDGQTVSLRRIGTYGTRPIYMNSKTPIQIGAKGKNGKGQFKNGKPHKTRYFKDGYKGYRSFIKKESSYVNLQIRGVTLKANYRMIKEGNKYLIGFVTDKSARVSEAMEKKYNARIWGLSNKDLALCREIVHNYIKANA